MVHMITKRDTHTHTHSHGSHRSLSPATSTTHLFTHRTNRTDRIHSICFVWVRKNHGSKLYRDRQTPWKPRTQLQPKMISHVSLWSIRWPLDSLSTKGTQQTHNILQARNVSLWVRVESVCIKYIWALTRVLCEWLVRVKKIYQG